MTRYAIGMGSNLGDRLGHLVDAVGEIAAFADPVALSPLYETAPVGGPDQDPFLNAVMVVDTALEPELLLERLQAVEAAHGRERAVRWGPRTLDLDLVTSDGPGRVGERLTLPHPRAGEREFVLRPLADVWPGAPLAGGVTAASALPSARGQGVDLLGGDWVPPVSRWKARALVAGQFVLVLVVALVLPVDGSLPDGEATVTRVFGALIAAFGVILAFIASRRLGTAMTPSPVPRPGAALVVSGPYRFARHPIYGGVTLVMMGTALLLDSVWGFAAASLLVPYFLLKSGYEERQLRMRYPGYRDYREVVRRRLIPFVV